ncbi:MAG: hypothetical protein F4X57_00435 [Chloroflexi bacterium]|nr:hypothetical protein [Chloroflexota bacterium]
MKNKVQRLHLAQFALVFIVVGSMIALACGVESGNRRPARSDEDKTGEFHRSPVASLEQFRIDVEKTDDGCTADPADIVVGDGQRVRLAVQLQGGGEITTSGGTGSTQFVGERDSAVYSVDGLTISSSGGALGSGVTALNLELESGRRLSYDFNASGAGAFDILCDGDKVGTFTVN